MKLHEAKLASSNLLQLYDEFSSGDFVSDTEGTRLNSQLVVGDFSVMIRRDNKLAGRYEFETGPVFDHEVTSYGMCTRCGAEAGEDCNHYGTTSRVPHRGRFMTINDDLESGKISTKDTQLAISFVKSVLNKHKLPYENIFAGFESDQFIVYVMHPQLGTESDTH